MICLHGFDRPEQCFQCPKAPQEVRARINGHLDKLQTMKGRKRRAALLSRLWSDIDALERAHQDARR